MEEIPREEVWDSSPFFFKDHFDKGAPSMGGTILDRKNGQSDVGAVPLGPWALSAENDLFGKCL